MFVIRGFVKVAAGGLGIRSGLIGCLYFVILLFFVVRALVLIWLVLQPVAGVFAKFAGVTLYSFYL